MPLTVFTTDQGHFESTRVPFDGKRGPAAFNRAARLAFNGANYILNFIDDFIIKSKSIEEHFEHLEDAFNRIKMQILIKLNIKM